jgi:hypothetical protein
LTILVFDFHLSSHEIGEYGQTTAQTGRSDRFILRICPIFRAELNFGRLLFEETGGYSPTTYCRYRLAQGSGMYARYLKTFSSAAAAVALCLFAFAVWIGEKSGAAMLPEEAMLAEDMGTVQSGDANIVAEPFDLRYWAAMKIRRIAHDQPEVVSIGSSRSHGMGSAMFKPYRFYNASLTAWTLARRSKWSTGSRRSASHA